MGKRVTCPHCDGDGEEPGAPADPNAVALCTLCNGTGDVTPERARRYERGD